jgi:hypothetical protein
MRSAAVVLLCLPFALAGCALSNTAAPAPDAGLSIQGSVHGGQQPISGAHVYLLAANTTGNAGPGIAASLSNASVSLLQPVYTGNAADSIGSYVTTGADGGFTITGDYSCTPNTQVYLYALGGNTGGGTNPEAGLLALLGNCPSSGNFLTATPFIVVNEISTVAAAYSFAGYASDATHVSSSGTALAEVGIMHAFATASNLENLSTGVALATTPNGNGGVPQQEINALADILASCINTAGTHTGPTNPTPCYTLLNSALSSGTTGNAPAETATAAINIAHNPAANVSTLYGLASSNPPFATTFAQPTDFTLGIQYTGGGVDNPSALAIDGSGNVWITNDAGASTVSELSSNGIPAANSPFHGGGLSKPYSIAIDSSGDVWLPNSSASSVSEYSMSGTVISGSPYSGDNLQFPYAVAIDGSDNAWVTNDSQTPSVTEISSSGSILSGTSGYGSTTGLGNPISIAIDESGAAWIADNNNSDVVKLSSAGVVQSGANGFTGGGLATPYFIAIDGSGNAWVANYGNNNGGDITKLSSSGTALSPSTGYTGGGVNVPYGIAIDGAGNVWTANNGSSSLTELSNNGVAISPATGFTAGNVGLTDAIAIDGAGNVWTTNAYVNQVTELVGAAVPVVTPLSAGVKNHSLGARP